ncbi:hypothetical protein HDU97_005023 [Phlyctochytrium planicorne]|nr:hypothetical protein HDU97_005023 [Phlyctochytrium planicorne]
MPTCRSTSHPPPTSPPSPLSTLPLQNHAGCGAVQPVSSWTTYFDVFSGAGVTITKNGTWDYDIDLGAIKRRFLRIQQAVHPDTHANKSEEERKYSDMQSTFINKALQTLKDPLLRARYLLHLNDVHIDESEKLQDPELLEEVMSVWEQVEEVRKEADLQILKEENEARVNKAIQDVSKSFREGNLEAAKNATVVLQYWLNLKQQLHDLSLPN